jgi:PBSX family phage portal protein
MALNQKRQIKVRSQVKPAPAAVRNRRSSTISEGGLRGIIGNTAVMSGLTDLETIDKSVYGLFEGDLHGPNYSMIEGDIITNAQLRIMEPVYGYKDLIKTALASTILRQCVDSYVTNIESYGTELEYIGPEGQEQSRAAQNEKARINRIMAGLTNDERTVQKHREDSRIDKEILGARCFEIIRDAAGRVVGFDHVPTVTMRVTNRERDYTTYQTYDQRTGAYVTNKRRFRRFVQIDERGQKTWFKEYGDPRIISPKNGEVDNSLSIEDEATEIYYDALYFPGTPYGIPRWAGAIPSLLGSREAEMVNLNFFRDNAIPAMAVLISGGALTEESFDKIDNYIQGVRGAASMNRIVVMEAVSDGSEAAAIDGSLPAPKIDIKPMLSERQHEGLFKDYIGDSERKARSTFRLPPIYIGSASEYNRASAFASMLTADQQIFVPERTAWDTMFDRIVLSTHNVSYWRVRSSGPGLQDPAEVSKVVQTLGKEGALTANVAIKIANRYLDANIQPVMDEWGDLPFSIILEYVKKGDTIKGLDIFEERVSKVLPPDPDADPLAIETPVEQVEAVQKVVRRLLDEVSDRMASQLDEALQSIAV